MGCQSSSQSSSSSSKETDLRKCGDYDEKHMWICDIEESAGDTNCDFLFLADITGDGDAGQKQKRDDGSAFIGRCIFSSVMYDINNFVPDTDYDGKLNFEIGFGARTVQRKSDAPNGWTVKFLDLVLDQETRRYKGKVNTSWWGDKSVTLIPYGQMSASERSKFPDLVAEYYQSIGVQTPSNKI